ENCPDLRNTRIVDIIKELAEYNIEMDIFDPWVDPTEASHEYGLSVISQRPVEKYDGVIIAVAHQQFQSMSQEEYRALTKEESIIYDLKYVLSSDFADIRL
ncbi:UDP binding domain-containing protein, partial [Vibrio sp. 10N.222.54.B11]